MRRSGLYLDLTVGKKEPPKIFYESKASISLGDGFYGTVYRCGTENGLEVAVKYLKPDVGISTPIGLKDQKTARERYRNRLCREYNIWKDLRHRNVAPLIGYWIDQGPEGEMCLVTNFYSNGTLKRYSKGLDITAKLLLLRGAAKGLAYLHSKHIVHHDIKASNVVVDNNGVPLLIDFGVSFDLRRQSTCTTSNKSEGRQWLPPERVLWQIYAKENKLPQKSTDVWSFGCLLLEVITERDPWIRYPGDTHNELSIAMRPEKHEKPGEENEYPPMPNTVWELCKEECWDYRPDKRPSMDYICRKLKPLTKFLNNLY